LCGIVDAIYTNDIRCSYGPEESTMAWTVPTLIEICIGLEINGYLPAEF
jgi:coenzyme PQQ precursor peptide PqqA